jgi:hypothetical protein
MRGIRRLFLPHVGKQDSVRHLFEEFQDSLWDRRTDHQDVPLEKRTSPHSGLHEPADRVGKRLESLEGKPDSLREILCELLSEASCAEWLGFNDLDRHDTRPPLRRLAGLVREPEWTDRENIDKLRMYRAAAFIGCLRPGAIDWETPHMASMELVSKFIKVFSRLSAEDQTLLIDDLSRSRVALEKIVSPERRKRARFSESDLRYVWDTKELSHRERAEEWDKRKFHPFGEPNLKQFEDKKLRQRWLVAVGYQIKKAKTLFDQEEPS